MEYLSATTKPLVIDSELNSEYGFQLQEEEDDDTDMSITPAAVGLVSPPPPPPQSPPPEAAVSAPPPPSPAENRFQISRFQDYLTRVFANVGGGFASTEGRFLHNSTYVLPIY